MDKLLTIIIPNKNNSQTILRQLYSIANQTKLPDELILIDDGSDDNSVEIIEKFKRQHKEKFEIKTFYHDTNLGCVKRISEGISASTSCYIYGASANDYLTPTFVEKTTKHASENKYGLVSCCYGFPEERFYSGIEILPEICGKRYYIPGHGTLVKKSYLEEFGGFIEDLKWHSDWFFLHSIALKYGWYGIGQELAIKTPDPEGYGNKGSLSDEQGDVIRKMVEIIETEDSFKDIKYNMYKLIRNLTKANEVLDNTL